MRDRTLFPLTAFRELIANALIHRDLSAWSETLAVEVRLMPDRLTIVNPGGLYGVTVDRLGKESVSSPRNSRLITLCQDARTPDGNRVVEGMSTGLQKVAVTLASQGLPAARYFDSGSRFTALLAAQVAPKVAPVQPGTSASRVYGELVAGPLTVAELEGRFATEGSQHPKDPSGTRFPGPRGPDRWTREANRVPASAKWIVGELAPRRFEGRIASRRGSSVGPAWGRDAGETTQRVRRTAITETGPRSTRHW